MRPPPTHSTRSISTRPRRSSSHHPSPRPRAFGRTIALGLGDEAPHRAPRPTSRDLEHLARMDEVRVEPDGGAIELVEGLPPSRDVQPGSDPGERVAGTDGVRARLRLLGPARLLSCPATRVRRPGGTTAVGHTDIHIQPADPTRFVAESTGVLPGSLAGFRPQ